MFFNFLLEKHCSACDKLDRSHATGDNVLNSNRLFCSCSELKSFYFKSTILLRIMQTTALVVLFTATVSTLFLVRNSSIFNTDINTVITGYANTQKGLDELNSKREQEQFAQQTIFLENDSK